eukprot:SM000067S20298  [mRNA]  locus=s67:135027:137891:+ [translate_table: standard]
MDRKLGDEALDRLAAMDDIQRLLTKKALERAEASIKARLSPKLQARLADHNICLLDAHDVEAELLNSGGADDELGALSEEELEGVRALALLLPQHSSVGDMAAPMGVELARQHGAGTLLHIISEEDEAAPVGRLARCAMTVELALQHCEAQWGAGGSALRLLGEDPFEVVGMPLDDAEEEGRSYVGEVSDDDGGDTESSCTNSLTSTDGADDEFWDVDGWPACGSGVVNVDAAAAGYGRSTLSPPPPPLFGALLWDNAVSLAEAQMGAAQVAVTLPHQLSLREWAAQEGLFPYWRVEELQSEPGAECSDAEAFDADVGSGAAPEHGVATLSLASYQQPAAAVGPAVALLPAYIECEPDLDDDDDDDNGTSGSSRGRGLGPSLALVAPKPAAGLAGLHGSLTAAGRAVLAICLSLYTASDREGGGAAPDGRRLLAVSSLCGGLAALMVTMSEAAALAKDVYAILLAAALAAAAAKLVSTFPTAHEEGNESDGETPLRLLALPQDKAMLDALPPMRLRNGRRWDKLVLQLGVLAAVFSAATILALAVRLGLAASSFLAMHVVLLFPRLLDLGFAFPRPPLASPHHQLVASEPIVLAKVCQGLVPSLLAAASWALYLLSITVSLASTFLILISFTTRSDIQ